MRRLCTEAAYPSALLAVAGYGLSSTRPFPSAPVAAWPEFVEAARKHRLLGHLSAAVTAGALPTTDEQRAQVRAVHRATVLRMMSLERLLVTVASIDVPMRVLKGSAYAHLDYPDPALRSYIDLDLLFRPTDFPDAVAALTELGFARTLAEPRPGFDSRFDKGTTLRRSGMELDLHRTFVLGPWGRLVDIDSLWASESSFTVDGVALRALSGPNRFLHACYHAALGDWPLRLGSLRDVAQLLPHASLVRAQEWGVQAVVAAAVADATRLLGLPLTSEVQEWAAVYVPSQREEQWLALHTHEDKTFAAQALATLPMLPGVREKAAYLRALMLPSRDYTADRHPSPLSRIRFGVREALRGRGR
jgi:hypothetical protein